MADLNTEIVAFIGAKQQSKEGKDIKEYRATHCAKPSAKKSEPKYRYRRLE